MSEERQEVFRGHLEECLRHLGAEFASKAPKGSRGSAQVKKPLADHCEVAVSSVTRWINGGILPIGKQFIGLMCYLDTIGYRIIEFERMTKIRRNFAELIGFKILSSDEAAEFLGYASTSTLYQMLYGNHGASDEKYQKMWDRWKEEKEELERIKKRLREFWCMGISSKASPEAEAPLPSSRPVDILSAMKCLLVLLEEELSDDLVIFQGSSDTVLLLSARLSALSSRLIISEQRKGGG